VLPFEWPVPPDVEGARATYTNEEFYELTAPNSPDLTYVYNSLSYWPGCSNNHTFTVEYPSPTFAPTVNPKNERRT